MKNLKRSTLATLLVLIFLATSFVFSYAAEPTQPTEYSSEHNSGQRDVVCTTLDGTSAGLYYTGDYTYDVLSELSASDLKSQLTDLMTSTHSYISSYDDCHYKADRTDCQNGDESVSLIYTSYAATMSQWNGWNREHVWPKSLGGDSTTGGGADLHHIRPADAGVNSSRGNKKYGESGSDPTEKYGTNPAVGVLGGTYNSTYFEPLDNVKGDVARICLYVMVRWGSDWGASDITDVFESVDVLLEWCELDPVDTWEMGRNEVVEDIQGNRNVFIDYPEYAWLIFSEEIPTDMVTPSGAAMNGTPSSGGSSSGGESACAHENTTTNVVEATCTTAGKTTVTCNDCGEIISTQTTSALGHSYVGNVCEKCGSALPTYACLFIGAENYTQSAEVLGYSVTMPSPPALSGSYKYNYTFVGWAIGDVSDTAESPELFAAGESVEISEDTTFYAVYSYTAEVEGIPAYIKKDISEITDTDTVIITVAKGGSVYALSSANGTSAAPTAVSVTVSDGVLTSELTDEIKWNIENLNDGLTIYPIGTTEKWLYCIKDNNGVRVGTGENQTFIIEETYGYLFNVGQSRYIGVYNNADWRCYTPAPTETNNSNITGQTLGFYVLSTVAGTATYYTTELTKNDAAPECEHTDTTTTTVNATCTAAGSITVTCNECGEIVSSTETAALGHNYVDGICARCGYTEPSSSPEATESGWILVTDVSSLKAGDQVVIVSKDADYALSTTQNGNNRGQAAVSKDGSIITFGDDVQILTLAAGTIDGTFAFYTGSGYLYAASSSKNYLRTETTLSANSSWTITISDGVATIKAQGTNTHNWLRYNSSNSLFSTYASGQGDVQIYKYVEASSSDEDVKISAASMTVGTTLAMNYYVSGFKSTDYYMVFTMNGIESERITGIEKNGYLVFSFENIAPQFMTDNIAAVLYDSEGNILAELSEYSIKAYLTKVIEYYSTNEEMMDLVADMLRYGAAAQQYKNYKADALVTDGLDIDGFGSGKTVTEADNLRNLTAEEETGINSEIYTLTALGVRFDFDNKIYVKFKTDDLANVTVKFNGTDVTANAQSAGDGIYVIYTDGISATQFDKLYTVQLYVGEVLHQTATYSVNSYVYAKHNSSNTNLAALVDALYNYGKSAKAYNS